MTIVVQSGVLRSGANTTTGLKAYWLMNEGSGTAVADSSGNSHNLVLRNFSNDGGPSGTMWSGGYLSFPGTGDVARVADHADFTPGTAFTVFGWVKAAAQVDGHIVVSQYNTVTAQRSWYIGVKDDPSPQSAMRVTITDAGDGSGNFKRYFGSQTVFDDTWRSVAARWNNGTLDLFVNGVKDPSLDKTLADATLTANTVANSTASLIFGDISGVDDTTGILPFTGLTQRFRFYNISKTDADIAAMHALGHA